MITLIGLGLRISEACRLRVEDIDFLRRTVHVNQQRRPRGDITMRSIVPGVYPLCTRQGSE